MISDATLMTALGAVNQLLLVDPSDGGPYTLEDYSILAEASHALAMELVHRGHQVRSADTNIAYLDRPLVRWFVNP